MAPVSKNKISAKQPIEPAGQFSRTKIIATLGPATDGYEIVEKLISSGVDGLRLNLSHGLLDEHSERVNNIRQASSKLGRPVAIIADLQGPKLRVGNLPIKRTLTKGQIVKFQYEKDISDHEAIPTQYDLSDKVKKGERLLLSDGRLQTVVEEVRQKVIHAKVMVGGSLSARKGINLPDTSLKGDILTHKDLEDIRWAVEHDIDYIALSFVQTGGDIEHLRRYLKELKSDALIIAKVETQAATEHIEEIVMASDAVMVARGDLAIETPAESVPMVQRKITGLCMRYGKCAIVATQMLLSMTDNPEPTRAEVSDVASAVITGNDAVMLSEETSIGKYPLETLDMMKRICIYTEENSPLKPLYMNMEDTSRQSAISSAIMTLAHQIRAKTIIAETMSGRTARSLAAHRPSMPIMMVTNSQRVANQLAIVYGGHVFYRKSSRTASEKLTIWLKSHKAIRDGDIVVIASGQHPGIVGGTDTIKVRVT